MPIISRNLNTQYFKLFKEVNFFIKAQIKTERLLCWAVSEPLGEDGDEAAEGVIGAGRSEGGGGGVGQGRGGGGKGDAEGAEGREGRGWTRESAGGQRAAKRRIK